MFCFDHGFAALLALTLCASCTSSATAPATTTSNVTATSVSPAPTERPALQHSAYQSVSLPPGPSPTCAVAIAKRDVAVLLAAFRAARLRGSGAEGCLTKTALASYSDQRCNRTNLMRSPGPLVLYRCGRYPVIAVPLGHIEVARHNPHDVQLDITILRPSSGGSGAGQLTLYEHLTVGAGMTTSGHLPATQIITGVFAV